MAGQALSLFLPPFPLPLLVLIRQWNSKLHNRWTLSLWHKENLSSHLPRLYSHHLTRHPPNVGARSSSYPLASTFDLLTTDHSCHFSSSCCYNRMHVKFAWFLLSFGSRGFHFPLHKSVRSLLNVRTRVVSRLPVCIDSCRRGSLFISTRGPLSFVTSFTFSIKPPLTHGNSIIRILYFSPSLYKCICDFIL